MEKKKAFNFSRLFHLWLSHPQGSGCVGHFGLWRSNAAIHTHAETRRRQSGEAYRHARCFVCKLGPGIPASVASARQCVGSVCVQNLNDSDWTNSLYPSPQSGMENTSFFTKDVSNLSSALLKEDDPGEGGERSQCA